MNDSLNNRVMKVKVQSFIIMIVMFAVIHGLAPWWLFYSACYGLLAWALYGYKKVFKGWPAVTTLRQSGRAFILACAWPVTTPNLK